MVWQPGGDEKSSSWDAMDRDPSTAAAALEGVSRIEDSGPASSTSSRKSEYDDVPHLERLRGVYKSSSSVSLCRFDGDDGVDIGVGARSSGDGDGVLEKSSSWELSVSSRPVALTLSFSLVTC